MPLSPQQVRNLFAGVVKLVDTHVSGTCEATRGGSSPLLGTKTKRSS